MSASTSPSGRFPAASPGTVGARLGHLPILLLATGLLLVPLAVAGWLTRGGAGVAGAAAGTALVAVSFVVSSLAVAWADRVAYQLVLPVALGTYLLKFSLLGVVMSALAGTEWTGLFPMGWSVVAGTLVWIIVQSWWTWRTDPMRTGEWSPVSSAVRRSDVRERRED